MMYILFNVSLIVLSVFSVINVFMIKGLRKRISNLESALMVKHWMDTGYME